MEFSAAAWKCAPRDQWIGWSALQREAGLAGIANNSRFLILPWVEFPQLASCVLGQIARRIAADWQAKYGHPVALLETFVEAGRFRGTCNRAANWQRRGSSTGRSRQDRHGTLRVPVKDVYAYPLGADPRKGPDQQRAEPIWQLIRQKAQELQPQLLTRSSLGKSVRYFHNEYEPLIGYLQSGSFQVHNNLVENSIGGPAVGRRKWLLIGHLDAGSSSAVIYPLIVSCRRHGINPWIYLTNVLQRHPSMSITQIGELLLAR